MGKIGSYTENVKKAVNLFNHVSTLNTQLSVALEEVNRMMGVLSDTPFKSEEVNGLSDAYEEASELVLLHKNMCDECASAYINTAANLARMYNSLKPIVALEMLAECGGENSDKRDSDNK